MFIVRQSTKVVIPFGPFLSSADGVTLSADAGCVTAIDHATTGIFVSKNGGNAAVRSQPVTASVADDYGMMRVTLATGDVDTLGTAQISFAKAASYLPVWENLMVVPANIWDSWFSTVYQMVDVKQWLTGTIPAVTVTGVPKVDIQDILGSAISTPAVTGILDVNVKNINNVATTSVTTINANQGTTQPVNFTGTGATAYVKGDMIDIASAAVTATSAQIGVNVVQINKVATTSVATINANQGTTQPVNFTGTGATAYVQGDMIDIASAAVTATSAQIGVNVVQVNKVATTSVSGIYANQGTIQPINFTGNGTTAYVQGDMIDIASAAVTATSAQIGVNVVQVGKTVQTAGDIYGYFPTLLGESHIITTLTCAGGTGDLAAILAEVTSPDGTVVDDVGNTASTFCTDLTSAVDDFWKGAYLKFKTGDLAGQVKKISGYTGLTKFITLSNALTSVPVSGSVFDIINR